MANTIVRTVLGQFPSDTSTFDIVAGGGESRNPTGCVVIVTHATALDTDSAHLSLSFGVTDFTTVACCSTNDENGIGSNTDSQKWHQETNIVEIGTPGTDTVIRSATVAAITGGIRLTPLESGAVLRVQAILIFGSVCKAFSSDGDGDLAIDETFDIAHGMSTEPGAGIYAFCEEDITGGTNALINIGFHAYDGTIEQATCGWFFQHTQSTTNNRASSRNDRCVSSLNSSGSERRGIELTAIGTTNVTYTNRTVANTEKYVGLLIECDDVATDVLVVDSPTSAGSDWDYTGLSFTPQFVSMVLSRSEDVNTQENNGGNAGAGAFMAMDEDGGIHSCSWATEDGSVLGTTNTSCEVAQALYCPTDIAGDSHLMDTHALVSTGWSFAAADIDAADGTIRRWPMLAIEAAASGISPAILRRRGR